MGLQGMTGGYKGLQGERWGSKGLHGVTGGYKGLQGERWGSKGLHGVTGGYKGFWELFLTITFSWCILLENQS